MLRELAKRQAEIAALPVMAERVKLWYGLNDAKTAHPLVTMEFHGLARDVYPPLTCENAAARALESQMAMNVFKHDVYKDDRVIPAFVMVPIQNHILPFDFTADSERVFEADGSAGLGYMYKHAVHDFESDINVFRPSAYKVDAGLAETYRLKEFCEEILGDILPVRPEFPAFTFCPANVLIRMMSMETMFCSLLDYPELFHKIMRRLTDEYHAYIDALEAGGAIILNNDASHVPMDTYGYTHDLPGMGVGVDELDRPVKLSDVWGYTNFQETVGMSVPMFDEFFFSYTKEILDRCGLVSYGCCEPVHTLWDQCLSRMKNLRKVSVSAWCDEDALGDMIRGRKIVFQRKPFPNLISVDSVFDDGAFLEHMKHTVKAARGCPLEVTFRDVTSVRGEPWRLTRAVELTREAFSRWWQG
jgi:hypothetical protein